MTADDARDEIACVGVDAQHVDVADGPLVAFLGPTLPEAQARALAPDVVLLPPVCQGDVTTVVEHHRPRAILIVDGEFAQALSVWHKEILHALRQGVRVLGASSMGALRAAELDRFGMEGVGEIYGYYRDGWLTADSDVALVHATAADGYAALTWPVVNVRATVEELRSEGLLDIGEAECVLEASERLHFTERTGGAMVRELASVVAPRRAAEIGHLLEAGWVDLKARDAALAFERLTAPDVQPADAAEVPRHLQGRGFEALHWTDVEVFRRTGRLRRYQLVDDVALHEPDFAALLDRAFDRHLVVQMALDLGVVPTSDEHQETRRRRLVELGIDEEGLAEWLADSDLDTAGFEELVHQEALVERMRRWVLDGNVFHRNRRLVIEQLQLEGRYPRAADSAARRRTMADARPAPAFPTEVDQVVDLVARQRAVSGWSPRLNLAVLADEQGFDSLGGLLVALGDARAAYDEQQERRARISRVLGLGDSSPSGPGDGARVHALLEAHQVTQVLLSALELGVPAALAHGPRAIDALARDLAADRNRLERLLRGLAALGIVRLHDQQWRLTADGTLLAPGSDGKASLADYAEHLRDDLVPAWQRLAEVVRGSTGVDYPSGVQADRHIAAATDALGIADAVLEALSPPPGATVADIGGGLGLLAERLAARHPDTATVLVELPGTATRAAHRLAELGLEHRVRVVASTEQRVLEGKVDVCVVVRVLATLDDEAVVALLGEARRSLAPGDRIEVFEPEADDTLAAALNDLLHLARSGGAVRSAQGWSALAASAGLRVASRGPFVPPFTHLVLEPATEVET